MFRINETAAQKHRITKPAIAACFNMTINMVTAKFITPGVITPGADGKFSVGDIVRIANHILAESQTPPPQELYTAKEKAAINKDLQVAFRQQMDGELSQVELIRTRGQLIPVAVATTFFADAMTTLRARLIKLPAILALQIDGDESTQQEFALFADNEIRRELIEAADVVEKIPDKIIETERESKQGIR